MEADRRRLFKLSLAALGVVFGDIGTSPLYAVKECFSGEYGIAPSPANILGVLSLIFWTLVLIVTIKYLLFVLKADNDGEGGVIALTGHIKKLSGSFSLAFMVALGLFAACMLYGDGMITPAISVLSAVSGLTAITPAMREFVLPTTVVILILLFLFQRKGTAKVGVFSVP
nr:KUP/HAK/KT family potassium transporter [Thermosulfidibacter takaii]